MAGFRPVTHDLLATTVSHGTGLRAAP